ncbi:ZIP family metal transporter [Methyloversatilis sp.]|uniref:ZIP family metal transporter n=1 Tax=Methyloversatilis sp. TaxID=2569862 RepID=UPI0035B3B331
MDPTPATTPGSPRPDPLRPGLRLDPALQFLLMTGLAALLALLSWAFADARTPRAMHLGLLAGLAGFAATTLGALPALGLRSLGQRGSDVLLGFGAGMMLAAASFSLIVPGLDAGETMTGSRGLGAAVVVIGMALGVWLMMMLDAMTPHEHEHCGSCGPETRMGRVWLFVNAIALHNLPEGMAMGVSFSQADMAVGLPLSTAIAIQDVPEGLAVAVALRTVGMSPLKAVGIAALSGFMEPLGALIGVGLSSSFALFYPGGLGLAAGAMIFVVSHEVIPETHRNGHEKAATLGLMAGFMVMMVLDTTLG